MMPDLTEGLDDSLLIWPCWDYYATPGGLPHDFSVTGRRVIIPLAFGSLLARSVSLCGALGSKCRCSCRSRLLALDKESTSYSLSVQYTLVLLGRISRSSPPQLARCGDTVSACRLGPATGVIHAIYSQYCFGRCR